MATIRNPVEWSADQLKHAADAAGEVGHSILGDRSDEAKPQVRKIEIADLREVLDKGVEDFRAFRSDVLALVVIYPVIGIVLAWFALNAELLPLLFPLGAGFALVGPVAAIGLYEMSRRREKGMEASWSDALATLSSPSFGAILTLGLGLMLVLLLWLGAAQTIYVITLGPEPPESLGRFIVDVLTTGPGWAMIFMGVGVGFCFAVAVVAVSLVSFPMLLDRDVGLRVAVTTSIKAYRMNPHAITAWGVIVAAGLLAGSIPLFLGLIFVLPVLGHATWHLYRKLVV